MIQNHEYFYVVTFEYWKKNTSIDLHQQLLFYSESTSYKLT